MKKPKQYKPKKVDNERKYKRPGLITGRRKGYDTNWEKYRRRFLHHNTKCYACGASSQDGAKLHIDHVKPHRGESKLFWAEENLIPLCHSCHSIVTSRFDRRDDLEGKLKWIQDQREFFQNTSKVKVVSIPSKLKAN